MTLLPSVRGTHTAKVVGAGGDAQIDVDADGRVLLEFPWDRGDGAKGKSQHRVHVASVWAGAAWGFVQLPRIGQEVLVEYLEGDPARPIVTGRVFNSSHKSPYALPANKTQSGWKSRSLGGTAENFNELRFEDKKGAEHIHMQAEKNLQVVVKADETRTVGHSRSATMQHGDTHHVVGGGGGKKGAQTLQVGNGDQSLIVDDGNQIILTQKGAQILSINKGDQQIEVRDGNQLIRVQGNQQIRVLSGDQTNFVHGASSTDAKVITLTADSKIELNVGGSTLIMELNKIVLKVGGTEFHVDSEGILAKGPMIEVRGLAKLKMSAALVELEGKVLTKIKGAVIEAVATALHKIGGAVTMAG